MKAIVMSLVNLRWAYFHINPNYMKFYMDSERKEAHFQHRKTGAIHSNLIWVDEPNSQGG
jgi:hypothetical protein